MSYRQDESGWVLLLKIVGMLIVLGLCGWYYLHEYNACAKRGGELIEGALGDWVCVATPPKKS